MALILPIAFTLGVWWLSTGLVLRDSPHGIEVLKREAERIHPSMAGSTERFLPVKNHSFPHGHVLFASLLGLLQGRHVRRCRRSRSSEKIIEHEESALHGRSAGGI